MLGIRDEFDQAFFLQTVNQHLNVLARTESSSRYLRNSLRTMSLEDLKSRSAGGWNRDARIGRFESIGQPIHFNQQGFKLFLKYGSIWFYCSIHYRKYAAAYNMLSTFAFGIRCEIQMTAPYSSFR